MWMLFVVLLGIGVEPFSLAKHHKCKKGSMFMAGLSLLWKLEGSWTSIQLESNDV